MLLPKLESLFDLDKIFPTEQDCINYYEERRWKGNIISPFDPNSKVYKCANNRFRCKNTGKYFSVRTKTIFEDSNISLKKWFWVSCVLSSKGISSYELARNIRVTPKTAWFMLQRLRYGLKHPNFIKNMLDGFVEIDETFIGGKNKNRHKDKKFPNSQGRSWTDKIPVLGLLERGGNLIAQVVSNTRQNTLEPIIRANIKKGSDVYTDEWYRHSNLSKKFNHQIVNHSAKQYVNGKVSTNAIENRWSHLKRMIIGIYYWISKKHAQKYVDEFTFRSNTKKYNVHDRFDSVLLSTINKRLTYQQLIS